MKRILAILFLLFAFAGSALAADTVINGAVITSGAEPISGSATISNTGSVQVVCVGNYNAETMSATSDKATLTSVAARVTGNGISIQCFSGTTTSTGTSTVTCHAQFGDVVFCSAAEVTGIAASSYVDTSNSGTAASGSAMATGAFTTTATGAVIGYAFSNVNTAPTAAGGYTASVSDNRTILEYKNSQAAGSTTVSATAAGSADPWLIFGFGLIDAGGGGGATCSGALTTRGVGGC